LTEVENLLALNMIEGLGPSRLRALLDHFGGPQEILKAGRSQLKAVPNIGQTLSQAITGARETIDLKRELRLIERDRVKIITVFDEKYPANLKEIFDPPILLYVKGELLPGDIAAIAIVGSRRASLYGRSTCESLSYQLASYGISIVSGMARGIDTAAHRGALKGGGRTIAVLGSGLGSIYPPENVKLADEIASSGAIVSEFPMERPPYKENFPRRNRVISGLSLGVVVVEAAQRSGALITAGFALEQGREVFAVPGRADSFTSKGTHSLIKQGAKLVEGPEDILEELGPVLERYGRALETEAKIEKPLEPRLNEEERIIHDCLTEEPSHIDEVVGRCDFPPGQVLSTLTKLQIRRLIKELPGKMFVKIAISHQPSAISKKRKAES